MGEKLKEDEERLSTLKSKSSAYTILKDEVFHNRGIVMYAINQIMPQLSIEASNNLADLSAGRFSKVKLEAMGEGARYGISILVEGLDGQWHDVFEFSGGERTQINAALRFSIARELASLPQVGRTYGRMRTLFIDEGDLGSLDTESSRGLFVKKLLDMGEYFDRIILITHLSDVAEAFAGKVRVEMDQERTSRIILDQGGA
jgi:DNA repair exonuclease SbcCD ATPase subunit